MSYRERVQNYLEEYRMAKDHIKAVTAEIGSQIEMITRAKAALSDPAISDPENAGIIERLNAEEAKLAHALDVEIARSAKKCHEIITAVNSITDPEARAVIEKHYFEALPFWKVARLMFISVSKAKYLNNDALDYLAEILI